MRQLLRQTGVWFYSSHFVASGGRWRHLLSQCSQQLTCVGHERNIKKKISEAANSSDAEKAELPRLIHYSMDFAQQIHYSNDPLEPGLIQTENE